jgi:hypothetical protein
MRPFVPHFSHAGGPIEGRPPREAYQIEAGYLARLAEAAWASGQKAKGDMIEARSLQFAATARRLGWAPRRRQDNRRAQ